MEFSKRLNQLESSYARQEARLEHVDVNLEKLSTAYSDMAKTMAQLVAHHEEVQRLGQQMRDVQHRQNQQATDIALLKRDVEPISEMKQQLSSNTGVSNATKWLAGVVVAAIISAAVYGLRSGIVG